MPSTGNDVGVAFAAVFAAGSSTAIGAAIVFFPKLVKLASKRVLASSLSISAGVMTYVSFVEIFQKALGSFFDHLIDDYEDEEKRSGMANLYATLSFFLGVFVMMMIDTAVKHLSHEGHHHDHEHQNISPSLGKDEEDVLGVRNEPEEIVVSPGACCSHDPAGDLEKWQQKAQKEEERIIQNCGGMTLASGSVGDAISSVHVVDNRSDKSQPNSSSANSLVRGGEEEEEGGEGNVNANGRDENNRVDVSGVEELVQAGKEEDVENKKLVRMGVQTAVAIALHNFPEGLATFVAVQDDPKIGAILACAIGIHNIPEGFCVALPIYYATGNRMKAFWWGALSGASEPVGAFLGWLILANSFSDAIYGLMFGLVAGMMVMISLKELLPTAYRYDPTDTVVTKSLIAGMVLISLSLVLFFL